LPLAIAKLKKIDVFTPLLFVYGEFDVFLRKQYFNNAI